MKFSNLKLMGYVAIVFLSGCTTSEDVKKMILKNNSDYVKVKVAESKVAMTKSLKVTDERLSKGLETNAKAIAKLETTTKEHSPIIKKTSDDLNALIAQYTKEITELKDNLKKQQESLTSQNKGLDKSLDDFNNVIKEKGENTQKVVQGLEVFLRRTVADLETTLKTHTQLLSQVEMQSNINTETLGKIKELVKTRHNLLISVTEQKINSLKTNLKTLEDLGGFLKSKKINPVSESSSVPEKESLFKTTNPIADENETPADSNK